MLLTYYECLKKYGNDYQLKKAIKNGLLYKIKNGLYSDADNPGELEQFIKKHPKAIFTMESALYYLGISDVIPDKYIVMTDRNATKIKNNDVIQLFDNSNVLNIGLITIIHSGIAISVYNKERMLIEVARYKNKLPYDYYKEVIAYYRNHIEEIDISLVLDYLQTFPKKAFITNIIRSEVL